MTTHDDAHQHHDGHHSLPFSDTFARAMQAVSKPDGHVLSYDDDDESDDNSGASDDDLLDAVSLRSTYEEDWNPTLRHRRRRTRDEHTSWAHRCRTLLSCRVWLTCTLVFVTVVVVICVYCGVTLMSDSHEQQQHDSVAVTAGDTTTTITDTVIRTSTAVPVHGNDDTGATSKSTRHTKCTSRDRIAAARTKAETDASLQAQLRPVNSARIAQLFELLERGVGVHVGIVGGSISAHSSRFRYVDGPHTPEQESIATSGNFDPSLQPSRRYQAMSTYGEYFVAYLNDRWPVREKTTLNQRHRGLKRHSLWKRAHPSTTSSWPSLCLLSYFFADQESDAAVPPNTVRRGREFNQTTTTTAEDAQPYFPERMPDLLIVEYAVNDAKDEHDPNIGEGAFPMGEIAQTERIFRQVLSNPHVNTAVWLVEYRFNDEKEETGFTKREKQRMELAHKYAVPVTHMRSMLFDNDWMRVAMASPKLGHYVFGDRHPFWTPSIKDTYQPALGLLQRIQLVGDWPDRHPVRALPDPTDCNHSRPLIRPQQFVEGAHPNTLGHALMGMSMEMLWQQLYDTYILNQRRSLVDLSALSPVDRDAMLSYNYDDAIVSPFASRWIREAASTTNTTSPLSPHAAMPTATALTEPDRYILPTPIYSVNTLIDFEGNAPPAITCRPLLQRQLACPEYDKIGAGHAKDVKCAILKLGVIEQAGWEYGSTTGRQGETKFAFYPTHAVRLSDMTALEQAMKQNSLPKPPIALVTDSPGVVSTTDARQYSTQQTLTMRLPRGPVHQWISVSFIRSGPYQHLGSAIAWLSCGDSHTAAQCHSTARILNSTWDQQATQMTQLLIYSTPLFAARVREVDDSHMKTADVSSADVNTDSNTAQRDTSMHASCTCHYYTHLHVRHVETGGFFFSGFVYV